jgi:hypothetical protein
MIATYVYCLIAGQLPKSRSAPKGLPEMSAPRNLALGDELSLVVSDAPLARYGREPLEQGLKDLEWVSRCALAHEAVVEHAGKTGAVLPLKLFTLFHDDARALAHFGRRKAKLAKLLQKVAGCQEYGVRIALDERAARHAATKVASGDDEGAPSGASYLMRKKRVQEATRDVGAKALAEAERAFEALAKKAFDASQRPPAAAVSAGGRLLLDAAYLVRKKQLPGFQREVAKVSSALEPAGLRVTLTGPWPPYNFIEG